MTSQHPPRPRKPETPIEQWRTTLCPRSPYLAPELHDHLHLEGIIDGKEKTTSRIVSAVGHVVTTRSGSVYRLGAPSPKWLKWLSEHGKNFDAENPIRLARRGALRGDPKRAGRRGTGRGGSDGRSHE